MIIKRRGVNLKMLLDTEFIVILIAYAIIGTAGMILMRMGFVEIGHITFKTPFFVLLESLLNAKLIIGFLCYIISFLLFLFILSLHTITYGFPIAIGLSYAASILGACLILREDVSYIQWIGIGIIGLGIIIVTVQTK